MNRIEGAYAIRCNPDSGPSFMEDICINDNCNREDSCIILNHDISGYECHPKYKMSLFVNTAGPDEENRFSILDYEVYTHN